VHLSVGSSGLAGGFAGSSLWGERLPVRRVIPRASGGAPPGRDEHHGREPRRCRTCGRTPATRASQPQTAPAFPRFSAAATTDQGRVRSLDQPHHMRNEGTGNWSWPGAGPAVRLVSRAGQPATRNPAGQDRGPWPEPVPAPGRRARLRPGPAAGARCRLRRASGSRRIAPHLTRDPCNAPPATGTDTGPSASGRPAARSPQRPALPGGGIGCPAPGLPVPCAACAQGSRIRLRQGTGGQVSGRAPGQWWPQRKTGERPALSAAGSRGWPGCARRCGTAGVPGHGAHAARGELRHDPRNCSSSGIGAHEHHGDVSRPPAFTAVRSPLQGPTHTQPAPVLASARERARGAPGLVTAGSTAG
jgi:hypothetical protein